MRYWSFLASGLGAVALAITSAVAPRPVCADTVTAQEQQTPTANILTTGATSAQAERAGDTAAASLTVREMDVAALKKLLERDPKQPRPLLVNFWATWCEPCRDEFPDLVRIDTDYRVRGLEFVTISLDDTTDIKTTVPQFLKEMKASMPAYLLNVPEPEEAIAAVDQTWGGALPATFLFDARGQLAFRQMGRVKTAELRAALEKVLSEK